MIVLGLTGAIGMGKSTVARMLDDMGVSVFDADKYVHRALNKNGIAVGPIKKIFPHVYDRARQKTDREKLGWVVFTSSAARKKLENILHPLVRAAEIRFIKYHRARGVKLVVLDIPLLFETGADALCDTVLCVSAPASIQRARVLARPGWTPQKFKLVKAVQMSDAQKRDRADWVLDTSGTLAATRRDLLMVLNQIKRMYARNRP